jgi:dihydrofolate reductase
MGIVRFQVSVSVDGYMAGPDQSLEEPLGVGGEDLHRWMFDTEMWHAMQGEPGGERNASSLVAEEALGGLGATVMGRKMFGGGPGPWDEAHPWTGWWGENPPYHTPVFVLTHHPREPLEMEGGTTFFFVTDGIDSALAQARRVSGDRDVLIGGGASAINQYLAAGLIDEFELHVSPVMLGAGERLFVGVGLPKVEQLRVVAAPDVTHVKYRIVR